LTYPAQRIDCTGFGPRALTGGELAGTENVRLIYLDESGINERDEHLCVAGVIVHGDTQWRQVRDAIAKVVSDWLPPSDHRDFIFHATDLFHGSDYWDRWVWPEEIRHQILRELIAVIVDHELPVVAHARSREAFGAGVLQGKSSLPQNKTAIMYGMAAAQCIAVADHWIRRVCPSENASVTAEDADRVKEMMKKAVQVLQSPYLIYPHEPGSVPRLPLRHIIDSINYHEKTRAPMLQLADVCAFVLRRSLSGKPIPSDMVDPLHRMATVTFQVSAF
jgi:hypothetical protein